MDENSPTTLIVSSKAHSDGPEWRPMGRSMRDAGPAAGRSAPGRRAAGPRAGYRGGSRLLPSDPDQQRLQGEQLARVVLQVGAELVDGGDRLHRRRPGHRVGEPVAVGAGEGGQAAAQLVGALPAKLPAVPLFELSDAGVAGAARPAAHLAVDLGGPA